jgi:hypothetical protein
MSYVSEVFVGRGDELAAIEQAISKLWQIGDQDADPR